MDPTPNKIFIEESDTGRRVEVTFTDAAAPGVKKMLEGWLGQPAAVVQQAGAVPVAGAGGSTPSNLAPPVTTSLPPPAQSPDACPGCWRPVPTPHERDGVRLCDQEAAEIDSLRQYGGGTENAKLANRKLENWRASAARNGIRWEAPVAEVSA